MHFPSKTVVACVFLSVGISEVNAGVIIGGTRVVYDGNKKESSVSVTNPDSSPYLIQSWVESQNGSTEKTLLLLRRRCIALIKGSRTWSVSY